MQNGMNRVVLVGNLGADPELRVFESGQARLRLRLATNESYLDKHHVRQTRTEWHDVVVWGERVDALASILKKGASLVVAGSLHNYSYEKNGKRVYRVEVVADEVELVRGQRLAALGP